MILQTFDRGWGDDVPLKQLERTILDRFLRNYIQGSCRAVIINSTWYSDEYHDQVLRQIDVLQPDVILLVAFFDAAIPQPVRYPGHRAIGVGYYPGPGEIDFWALASERYMSIYDVDYGVDLPFMCLNRKPHWHRRRLYQELAARDLLDRGMVSMGGESGQALRSLPEDFGVSYMAPNAGAEQHGINNDIFSLGNPANWNRCLVNIVTETIYDINHNHFVSEKIYKPILGQRPFLVYSSDGARSWLENRGFQTYLDDWNDITDLDLADPQNIAPFLSVLCEQTQSYLRKKLLDLQPKIMYNKNRFHAYCTEQKDIIERGLPCPV